MYQLGIAAMKHINKKNWHHYSTSACLPGTRGEENGQSTSYVDPLRL